MRQLHFISSITKNGLSGGTFAWQHLLKRICNQYDITLHFSSDAEGIWQDFLKNELKHESHRDWLTYENRNYRDYDNSYKKFRFDAIPRNAIAIIDSLEAVRQLVPGLMEIPVGSIYLHLHSAYQIPPRNLIRRYRDLKRLGKIKKIIAVCDFVKNSCHLKNDIQTVYYGVTQADEAGVIEVGTKHACYFGRYEKYKNPLFLEELDLNSLYIGSTRGATSPVKIPQERDLGWMSPKEAAYQSDFFVFPCVGDAFPLSVLEMMCYGKICICFNSGGLPEAINHGVNGFLVEPFDVEKTKKILSELNSNPILKKTIQEAAVETGKKFTIDSYAENFTATIFDRA